MAKIPANIKDAERKQKKEEESNADPFAPSPSYLTEPPLAASRKANGTHGVSRLASRGDFGKNRPNLALSDCLSNQKFKVILAVSARGVT
jgi:hypothetical protein